LARQVLAWSGMAALVLMLAGCFATAVPDRKVGLPDPPKPAVPPTMAATATVREHQRIIAAYNGVYEDPGLEGMIRDTVEKLVAASDRPDQRYRITVLNSPAINAFALPSGDLYVTRGLIALANDTSEIASVLAHEMAHVVAQHATIREDRARQVALVNRVFDNFGSDPETSALALAKSKIALASFSRAQEFEADGIGVGIAARAGFDPYGAARFLTSMGRNSDLRPNSNNAQMDPRSPDFLSSHPATPERIQNAQTNARQFAAPGAGERNRASYAASIDGMIYGEDPSEGFVRGRRFVHPRLGFTFMAPDGFTLENTAQAVLGIKEGGSQALRLDVVRVPQDQVLTEYLTSGWIEGIDSASVENVGISGFVAATATAKGAQWNFRLFAVRFENDVYRFIFASKRLTTDVDRGFRGAVGTFRRLSPAESNSARPHRIKVITAAEGDTVERLASRMATHDHPQERFRALNGLGPNDRVSAGDSVKIVVE
jgi:predicted Zn-dependent protease